MNKGVSESFDEHEVDTAPRAYPQGVVEGAMRTTKMAKPDLNALRSESGTRAIVTAAEVERHLRQRLGEPEGASAESRERTSGAIPVDSIVDEDPHARPTIAGIVAPPVGAADPTFAAAGPAPAPTVDTTAPSFASAAQAFHLAPESAQPDRIQRVRHSPVPAWAVAIAVSGIALLVAAAGAIGFVLGRIGHILPR